MAKAAKALSRDECEAVVQALVLEGSLRLDFGFTAYATNAYLKATGRATGLLQVSSAGEGQERCGQPYADLLVDCGGVNCGRTSLLRRRAAHLEH